jgi:eukaryotic-like serine/threonine-protein kinase
MVEGSWVGAYQIVAALGAGGMSEVWIAEHSLLGRRAAIKVLRAELSRRSEVVTQFFHEARITTAVANPGIVQVFDFGFHTDGSAYTVMELLEGETLDRRLARSGVLAADDALQIVRQVARTLGVVHARGVVHRDLKPDNIFLVRDLEVTGGERAKLLDFGIAKQLGDRQTEHEAGVVGTPAFMSPEQCRGTRDVDQRSDIYSLGCLLFTLVTGYPPFDAADNDTVMAMHLNAPRPVPSRFATAIPPALDDLVLRCMAKDPARRFTAYALASAIDPLLRPWQPTEAQGWSSAPFSDELDTDVDPTMPGTPEAAVGAQGGLLASTNYPGSCGTIPGWRRSSSSAAVTSEHASRGQRSPRAGLCGSAGARPAG